MQFTAPQPSHCSSQHFLPSRTSSYVLSELDIKIMQNRYNYNYGGGGVLRGGEEGRIRK
jgi:hypothetical protein